MTTDSPPQDMGRARRRRAVERGGASGAVQPAGQPLSPFAPLDLVSRDELELIHEAALKVLKEIGVDFLHDEARAMLRRSRRRCRSGLAAGSLRSRACRGAYRTCAEAIRSPCAQSRAQSHHRRTSRRLRVGRQRSQCVRPRGRAAAGRQARLSELHPPRSELRFDSFLGRLSGRAGRHSRLDPASRGFVRHADPVRQTDPRL